MALTPLYITAAGAGAGTGADLANACAWMDATHLAAAAGTRHMVCGNVVSSGAFTLTNAGTATAQHLFTACDLVTGLPLVQSRLWSNTGPLDPTGLCTITVPDATAFYGTCKAYTHFQGFAFTGSIAGALFTSANGNTVLDGCSFVNTSANAAAAGVVLAVASDSIDLCDITLPATGAICLGGARVGVNGCRLSGGATGVSVAAATKISDCVFLNQATQAILDSSQAWLQIVGCTAYGCRDFLNLTHAFAKTSAVSIINSLCTDGAGYFIRSNAANNNVAMVRNTIAARYALGTAFQLNAECQEAWSLVTDGPSAEATFMNAAAGDLRIRAGAAAWYRAIRGGHLGALQPQRPPQRRRGRR